MDPVSPDPVPGARVALGLGSNVGNSLALLRTGVDGLAREGVMVEAVSSVYRSAPVGWADQPDFLNAVLVGRWPGAPEALLAAAQRVERGAGRLRSFPNAPRTLDVDLVLFDDVVRDAPDPILPHPRWRERAFVLAPLAEVAPGWRDPVGGSTVHQIWSSTAARLAEARVVAPASALWSPTP